jgi:anti-sigma factor ChrR (cupin superfamily)
MKRHPSNEDLARFMDGELGFISEIGIERHLGYCEDCRDALIDMLMAA